MKVLLWNTNKKLINKVIADIIIQQKADYITLIEYVDDVDELIKMINSEQKVYNKYITAAARNIVCVGRIINVHPGPHAQKYSIQVINDEMIMCCIHLPSRIYSQDEQLRAIWVKKITDEILHYEETTGIDNTIIMGDFNANPYESTCLSALGFHAIPSREVAKRVTRTICDTEFKMFYNPTWNLMGDFNYPPGTFFHNGSEVENSYWHLLDQVMIRPSLVDRFKNDSLKIIHRVGNLDLVDKSGHPLKSISDHLPIVYEIEDIK